MALCAPIVVKLQDWIALDMAIFMIEQNPHIIQIVRADSEENEAATPLNLGQRVRELRKARKWTLEQAAQQAGLARSTLSKIENEQMSPTFDAVKKLAIGLDVSLPQLFTSPKSDQVMACMATTFEGNGKSHVTPTYEHEMLGASLSNKAMLPYRARIRARSIDEFDGWVRHGGEEFLYVLTGKVRLYTEFYEPVDMNRGDSCYYDASMGHDVISTSQEDAMILWVTSVA
jgi:transcriptional regulator with XRE-family HTH domain